MRNLFRRHWHALSDVEQSLAKRLAILYLSTVGCYYVIDSPLLHSTGDWFVYPNLNHFPLLLLGFLLFLYFLTARRTIYGHTALHRPTFEQVFVGVFYLLGCLLLAHWVSHPTNVTYASMLLFIHDHPYAGQALFSCTVYLILILPILPMGLLLFPASLLARTWRTILACSLLFVLYLYWPALDASYYYAFGPYFIRTLKWMLLLLPHSTPDSLSRWEMGYRGFNVSFGYKCTEFASIALVVGLLSYAYWLSKIATRQGFLAAVFFVLLSVPALWVLNMVRIVGIMYVGATHPDFAVGLFHSSAGPILLFLFFLVFLSVTLPVVSHGSFFPHPQSFPRRGKDGCLQK